jgi:hypothetical protein
MKKTIFIAISFLIVLSSFGQTTLKSKFGKPYTYTTKDSSFQFSFGGRMQQRFVVTDPVGTGNATDDFILNRARLKSKGYLFTSKLKYAYQQDVLIADNVVMDFILDYHFTENFNVFIGRYKNPSHVSFEISSQKTSYPEREIFHEVFTTDRAEGIQAKYKFKIGKMVVTERIALTDEHWIKNLGKADNLDVTGRLAIFPFGEFTKKNYLLGADLMREQKLKLMIGAMYDYNANTNLAGGRTGAELISTADLSIFVLDAVAKYKGFTFMTQYAKRTIEAGNNVGFTLGEGFMGKLSYLNKKEYEFTGRYSQIDAIKTNQYSVGINKYIVQNNLKIQYSFDYNDDVSATNTDVVVQTLQLELAF